MMWPKRASAGAPSISAASNCSLSSDWIAVNRISVAKGSHCHETIRVMEKIGAWLSHSTGASPKNFHTCAKSPFTGSMNMFFQTSAETVGITKKGAMTRIRTMPCPHIGWSSRSASSTPRITVTTRTPPTMMSVVLHARPERARGDESDVVLEPDPAQVAAAKRQIALEREVERHGQRHEHPDQEQKNRGRHHQTGRGSGMQGCHDASPSKPGRGRVGVDRLSRRRGGRRMPPPGAGKMSQDGEWNELSIRDIFPFDDFRGGRDRSGRLDSLRPSSRRPRAC